MALFEAEGIHKRFGHQVVLERVDIAFEEGVLSGIVGPNGAGKTTLFNVLTGRYKPNRGVITFNGQNITGLPEHRIANMGISRSFQIMNLFDDFSVLENVIVALPEIRDRQLNIIRNVATDSALQDRAYRVLKRIGLEEDALVESKSLPYGKRRALEIGVALATNPKMLFLDEPTQGLGSDRLSNLIELIERLKQEVTIVIIEHDMHFLTQIADVISVVLWGQIIATDSPANLLKEDFVI